MPERAAALSGIYVAREKARPSPGTTGGAPVGMKALFHGRFEIRDNCLVFSGGGQAYLPLLSAATSVSVFPTRVEIGGRPHAFDRDTIITGGTIGGSGAGLLERRLPASCSSYPLLRVSGISAAS